MQERDIKKKSQELNYYQQTKRLKLETKQNLFFWKLSIICDSINRA